MKYILYNATYIYSYNINSRYWYIIAVNISGDTLNQSSARSTKVFYVGTLNEIVRNAARWHLGTSTNHTAHAQYRTSHLATSRLGLTIIIYSCLISVIGHHHPMSRTLHRLRNHYSRTYTYTHAPRIATNDRDPFPLRRLPGPWLSWLRSFFALLI